MRVKDLIRELEKLPQEAVVYIPNLRDSEYEEVAIVGSSDEVSRTVDEGVLIEWL